MIVKRKVAEAIYKACHEEWRGFIPRSIELKYDRMAEAAIADVRRQMYSTGELQVSD